jgi:hypothetical protein
VLERDRIIGVCAASNVPNPALRGSSWTAGLIVRYPRKTYSKVRLPGMETVASAVQLRRRAYERSGMAQSLENRRGIAATHKCM